jgi:hypothetical protein
MKWSDESVEKVAKALWYGEGYTYGDKAKAALSVIAELPEVRALVDAGLYILKYGYLRDDDVWAKLNNALTPFTRATP